MADDGLRIDVWLWRARFFKTRRQATTKAAEGRIRLARGGAASRIDKPSRVIRIGDELTFAIAARAYAVRVVALGARRGPAAEARSLYASLEDSEDVRPRAGIDNEGGGLTNTAPPRARHALRVS